MSKSAIFFFLILFGYIDMTFAEEREWTSLDGRKITADLVSADETSVVILKGEKTFTLPLEKLSEADREFISNWKSQEAERLQKEIEERQYLGNERVKIAPGTITTFTVDLPADLKEPLDKDGIDAGISQFALAVPSDFDPNAKQRVLVISVTSSTKDKLPSSAGHMRAYMEDALSEGWVLMAADGTKLDTLKLEQDLTSYRWAVIEAGLRHLSSKWPGMKDWEFACGGNSGGAKRSGYIAGIMSTNGYKMVGVYLAGCNVDTLTSSFEGLRPDRKTFLNIPIFISSGEQDRIADIKSAIAVEKSLDKTGFKRIRREIHPEGHGLYRDHIPMALGWFSELADEDQAP